MNRLHEVLEAAATEALLVAEHEYQGRSGHARAISASDFFCTHGASSMCFWAGDMGAVSKRATLGLLELQRLPFGTVWIEFEIQGRAVGAFCTAMGDAPKTGAQMILVLGFLKKREGSWLMMEPFTLLGDGHFEMSRQEDSGLAAGTLGWAVIGFLQALNCTNVERQLHTPDAKLQKARAKRGRRPLFSYSTLVLKRSSGEGVPLGGTHASPAVHLRRGHPRQYAPGKFTWVQPCVVGNPARGMVHKDYDASALTA